METNNSVNPQISNSCQNKANIISIDSFLSINNIRIPEYQRPYKWEEKNVFQLINDVFNHKEKSYYRLGTIVINPTKVKENGEEKTYLDIVDGQQRYTTLRIMLYALHSLVNANKSQYDDDVIKKTNSLKAVSDSIKISYRHRESIRQIHANYNSAFRLLNKYDNKTIRAFLEKCEVVIFQICDTTEAFQFFDSQNARGKDLYPHDLLKAYHLREFDQTDLNHQNTIVSVWEDYNSDELASVFAEYLFRIKGWANKKSSRQFRKKDVDIFKGINITNTINYPYVRGLKITHHFVDSYNSSYEREIDKNMLDYPFQLDALMINGRRFFEYIAYYKRIIEGFKEKFEVSKWEDNMPMKDKMFFLVYNNSKIHREGEKYIRALFECLVIYYIDKFGYESFDYFMELAFAWCFSLRFQFERLGFDSVDKHVLRINFFNEIKHAIKPEQILNINIIPVLPTIGKVDEMTDQRIDNRIKEIFIAKRYYGN